MQQVDPGDGGDPPHHHTGGRLIGCHLLSPEGWRMGSVEWSRQSITSIQAGPAQPIGPGSRLVLPPLVDLHTHIADGWSYWGVDPDTLSGATGTCYWVDAGSAGAYSIRGLYEKAMAWRAATYSFINISPVGLIGQRGELKSTPLEPAATMTAARHYPDFVRGVKIRLGTASGARSEHLNMAVAIGSELGLPVMVHIGDGDDDVAWIMERLRPGDIVTHAATPWEMKLIDDGGQLRNSVSAALQRGVRLDLGHGAGSFSFASLEALLSNGATLFSISSDLSAVSLHGRNPADRGRLPTRVGDRRYSVSLLQCVEKAVATGMQLEDALLAVTYRPAEAIFVESYGLRPGGWASFVVIAVVDQPRPLFDTVGARRTSRHTLRLEATYWKGRPLSPVQPGPPAPWLESAVETVRDSSRRTPGNDSDS